MPDIDRADFRPARESSLWILVILVVIALGAGAVWWRMSQKAAPVETAAVPTIAAPQPEAPPPPPATTPEPVGPQFPVDTAADATLPKLDDADAPVKSALVELMGNKGVQSFLQVDGFVRRFVATVDNLPREHAASRVWPVQPSESRFTVSGSGETRTIGPDNGARYTAFVLFAESVNTQRAVAFYTKFYPLFQQAFEELGYPNRYFNDRLVAVIDHLLQTPEPSGPVQVKLTEVKGEMRSERPWVRYEFVDPQLESLSAGQKMLVRVGLVNERRLKAKLTAVRSQIVSGAVAKK
jgi:flagellar basal body-associated protein FliL